MQSSFLKTLQIGAMACGLIAAAALASSGIRVEQIRFNKGASSAVVKGSIKGYETVDYSLSARAGQRMTVNLATKHTATYFNILAPGENEVAMFNSSSSATPYKGVLPANGVYKVRVYMMRSAARRNEVANYALTVSITGAPKADDFGKAPASDAKVSGTAFNATGPLPCRMGEKPMECQFGVIRGKPGNAEVHITPPGGLKRVLTFMGGKVTTTSGEKIKAVERDGDWYIDVNDFEHYTVYEAIIFGG